MQSSATVAVQLVETRNALVDDQRCLATLREALAVDETDDEAAAKLRAARQQCRDREDDIADLEAVLKIAEASEASAAGQKRRADAVETMLRAEAISLALEHAAAIEDQAGVAYQAAMDRRAALQGALHQQARQVFELVQAGPATDQRSADQVGLLIGAAEGGIPAATAFRVLRLAAKTKGMVAAGAGMPFVDATAAPTVASAAKSSRSAMLLRMAGLLQAAGIPVPAQGQQATREHAARIVASMADDTTAEVA